MRIKVAFYSYFKDLAGCAETVETLNAGESIAALLDKLQKRFPKFAPMRGSALVAVGVEYQKPAHVLKDGDEVALFPPVQGG